MHNDRQVAPEWLELLPDDHPRAIRSRRDIHRLNGWMNNARTLSRLVRQNMPPGRIHVLADLGAGEGRQTLRLARRLAPHLGPVQTLLVDRKILACDEACRQLHALGWSADIVIADVFDWLEHTPPVDAMVANLFLHHFQPDTLARLLCQISQKTRLFAACEPRRIPLAQHSCFLLGLIGCNDVTRHDAAASVKAGFQGQELSALWPGNDGWQLHEHAAPLFSHCFVAKKIQEA